MKVILLDFDGVLNNAKYLIEFKRDSLDDMELDPNKMMLLHELVVDTGAKIVLTSSWRFRPGLDRYFQEFGLDIYDRVPYLDNRGDEVYEWLTDNDVENYVIFDDESSCYSKEQMEHAIITCECYDQKTCIERPYFEGLQPKHIIWAKSMLNS